MIEAMSAGTPVIAWRCGSAPEVIADGVSGVIVDSVEAAAAAVPIVSQMSRWGVRAEFERRFTAERMARDYVGAYRTLLARRVAKLHPAPRLRLRGHCAPRRLSTASGGRQQGASRNRLCMKVGEALRINPPIPIRPGQAKPPGSA